MQWKRTTNGWSRKIAVKGITESGSTATEGFVYLESINLSKADPTATIQFDFKGASGIRKKNATVGIGYNLYDNSGSLDEYKVGFVVKAIDGRDNSVEFPERRQNLCRRCDWQGQ